MGITLEELATIVEFAEERQLVYSMGETSYYYPAALYCRERYRRGDLGAFVYGEGEYMHDLSQGFYEVFQRNGDRWKSTASYPPMLYPSHSVSIVLSVIGEHMTDVACLGYEDRSDDGVFIAEVSDWANTFSNESALFRTSGGGVVRINEMRRVGIPRDFVRLGLFGTRRGVRRGRSARLFHRAQRRDRRGHRDAPLRAARAPRTRGGLGPDRRGLLERHVLGPPCRAPARRIPRAAERPLWLAPVPRRRLRARCARRRADPGRPARGGELLCPGHRRPPLRAGRWGSPLPSPTSPPGRAEAKRERLDPPTAPTLRRGRTSCFPAKAAAAS